MNFSRGYYSELLTNENYNAEFFGSYRKTNLIYRTKTFEHSVLVPKISRSNKDVHYILPESDSVQTNFPTEAYKPKVQLQMELDPGTLTKKIATERLRRQYEACDIKDLLNNLGINNDDLVPPDPMKVYTGNYYNCNLSNFLPLELFDNEEYDIRTPENWLELGAVKDSDDIDIPGFAFIPAFIKSTYSLSANNNIYDWVKVSVYDYIFEKKIWLLKTLPDDEESEQLKYQLPRIYILFKSENPEMFAKRIQEALIARKETENKVRYQFYLDCMPMYKISGLNDVLLTKIFKLATRNHQMVINDVKLWNKLVDDIQSTYKQMEADMKFREIFKKNPSNEIITLPKKYLIEFQQRDIINTKMKNFRKTMEYFRWINIYVIPESYRAMYQVVSECLKINQMSLFVQSYGARYVTLEEFYSIQNHTTNNMIKHLKVIWLENIICNIRMNLSDIAKGWFDIKLKNFDIYIEAKLIRFMELIKHRMQYTLRILVESSIKQYIKLVEPPCVSCFEVDETFEWGDNLIDSEFVSKAPPIFSLILKLDADGAFYSNNLEDFGKTLLNLYDTALKQTHQVRQVHPYLLTYLRFPKDLCLSSVGLQAHEVCNVRDRFLFAYKKAIIPVKAYAKRYEIFIELYLLDVKLYIEKFKEENHSAAEFKDEISFQRKMAINIEETVPKTIPIGPFFISVEALREYLIQKRNEISAKLLETFANREKALVEEVLNEYKNIMTKLAEKPESIEHIYEIREWMETIPVLVKNQDDLTRRYMMEYEILDYFWYNIPMEDFSNKWEALGWPRKIHAQCEIVENFLKDEEERYYKIQTNDEMMLNEKIEGFTVQIVAMAKLRDFSKCHEIAVDMRRLWKAMREAQERGLQLNQRQQLFNVPVIPFDNLTKIMKEFEPYYTLWTTSSDWLRGYEMWMDNPVSTVDVELIEKTVSNMYKSLNKLIRVFADIEAVQSVAIQLRDEIDQFKPLLPLMQSLREGGMRQRHWDEFRDTTGVTLVWSQTLTFKDCLDLGIKDYEDVLVTISESASKEYAVEVTLNKMMKEWEKNNLDITQYKNTEFYIMKVSDEILQLIDDHTVFTLQLSFSPFKGPFEERINEWENTLTTVSNVIEEWIDVQRKWMYLEPILNSEDISKQLPTETKKYRTMERAWFRIMKGALDNPNVIRYCDDKALLETLRDSNHTLEIVYKGLSEYLEAKRSIFPRLFFLSDDELLEILSHSKDPLAVQPHLKKCFENIALLKFEEDLQITQMFSAEGECIDLNPTLYPSGSVEAWLLLVEDSMKNTMNTVLCEAIGEIYIKDRSEWVLNWPGQVVIAGSQTFWTGGVEDGMKRNALDSFFNHILLYNLDKLRSLVKGRLTFLQRDILSALIVIEVHSRDVTQNLVELQISDINDFEWISQLRYYWIENSLRVRAVNAEFRYGNEYLGNSGRLVITPLTDRCYLTLTGALHLKFGGAPAGPAGTGKTETTKDLAKAMALQCVVFNCSDQLDFMAMGKFFKGLASSGAWACFDEFNRIDIEVLSVVAQQITTIQKAQQARLDFFMFEGKEIALKQSCAVFITMNPGYAGRTELPDNLKSLFRPVSMMVPNYTLISEISLFSFGFGNAKEMANKITTTFKLSSEQLSTQDHYDFGMRAVKTVIAVAGNLKKEKPDMEERQIVLRAIRDVNVPKFLKDDLKLFNGIVSDLFPRMVELPVDYGILEESIRRSCIKMGYEDVNDYVKKVIQLYETTIVRHGLMLVGPTCSGKTRCYEILKDAITFLKGKMQPNGYPFCPVQTYVLNPKSITMGQLYGEFDLITREWTDGILPSLVRIGTTAEDDDNRWYVFDGPVDAVWIENMNTVLDDNKKLCLSSGEIIKLRKTQIMMFEVADLIVASPATVSRCGMVYLEPSVLGLKPFINCWIEGIPKLAEEFKDKLLQYCDNYALSAIDFIRNNCREILTSVDSQLLMSFLNLMEYRLGPLASKDNKPPPSRPFLDLIPVLLGPWVAFSLVWSIGATCDAEGREKFDKWLRDKMKSHKDKPYFPDGGLVYDFWLHDGGFTVPTEDGQPANPTWHNWMEKIVDIKITEETRFTDIEVPTIDNIRNAQLIEIILYNENNCLCVGPTGTGKSQTIISKLSKNMPKKFICDFMCFSARTMANQVQDIIDAKLDRRRRGVFGPPLLKQQIFFIDDFNMPALEIYGAQPPIELIRQWMDFKGWYDRKNIGDFKTIIDVNFCTAMGPPGGGRNPVTMRLLRHFHYLTFLEMNDDSNKRIFGTILKSWMDRLPNESLMDMQDQLLTTTLSVYKTILRELLPTPAKIHYTYNLRDLSKVFQGILMMNSSMIEDISEILKLWFHECCRVFQDRLINDEDKNWFNNLLKTKIAEDFQLDPDEIIGDQELIYCDFLEATSDVRNYSEITDIDKLTNSLNYFLNEYNKQTTRPANLVLFLDAIAHICKISRILRQPLGNGLLLGMGGSGRQSLTRLSCFISEYSLFQIEMNKNYGAQEWRDDIKKMMLACGLQKRETVFLFTNNQMKSEMFLEDLNNILNSGDVPNIYAQDELNKIYQLMIQAVQELGLQATKSNLFFAYQKQVRVNLHCIITMSPIGELFRSRLRKFPALVNCCTIDWFSAWPDYALQSVASRFLENVIDKDENPDIFKGVVTVCQFMQASVIDASVLFKAELGRTNYVTPASYLELLANYIDLMNMKRNTLTNDKFRLSVGLQKLGSAAEEIKELQETLKIMKPALEVAAKEAEIMIAQISKDKVVAEETKSVIEREEVEANKKTAATQAIADDAQKDLDEAMPDLLAAESSLKALNKNDVLEVRSMKRPPAGVVSVIETICIVKGVKPNKVPGLKPGEKLLDYWEPGRNMLTDPQAFLISLMNFDKESVTDDMIDKLSKHVNDPSFQPAKIAKVSKACKSLCMWIHAIYKYYFVNKRIAPKKANLKKAKEELEETERTLNIAKARLESITSALTNLLNQLAGKIAFKEEKEKNITLCEERMGRAIRLIAGLGDNKIRWTQTIEFIENGLLNLTGDILVSAGSVAYLTPFTDNYRRGLLSEWTKIIREFNIPCSEQCDPVTILGEAILIKAWQLDGLPRDYLSTENAILVSYSKRWPLFIDPQGQANKWIKNMGKQDGLIPCKLSDKDILRTLESAIRFGKPLLIENIAEELDPALDPIFTRAVFKQGGNLMIKLGDVTIPYDENFRLYMTTKLPNPQYPPEVSTKVLLVNFTLVPSGLQDQLLALTVMQERPDLEEQRSQIVTSITKMKQELKEMEDRILHKLSTLEESPIDDIDFIITLEASKAKSNDVLYKVASAEITQNDIENIRVQYVPVANRGQILYFCLSDLSKIDPMYQYSLEWFISIFLKSMSNTEKNDNLSVRVEIINEYFTFSLFTNVCQSLFEKHKLHFAFLLCVRILMDKKDINAKEWHYFLSGSSTIYDNPNPASDWLSDKAWNDILTLQELPSFTEFVDTFKMNIKHYKRLYESTEPHRFVLPHPFDEELTNFQKIFILKCFRPDKVTNAIQDFLSKTMGQRFIEPQTTDLAEVFKDSSPVNPLLFVLSPGVDPAAELYKFADKMKFSKRMFSISLGQGQGPVAEKMLKSGLDVGSWIFFQNCHLAPSWMPTLDRLIENISPDNVHRDFRIWLTSMPSVAFPVSILQNGNKMTVEPPSGIKANMQRAYLNQVSELADVLNMEHPKAPTFKQLLFSLCLFHSIILERRKFGPLGFNIPYEFTDGDLKICISQLKMFLWEYDNIPFKVLTYTAGHINYGGRITDDWDRRCLISILASYYSPNVVNTTYVFDIDKFYHQLPKESTYGDYLDFIKTFPINDSPDIFGLHENADVTFAQSQTAMCLNTLLKLQPKQTGDAASGKEEFVSKTAATILNQLPNLFDIGAISKKYPVLYEESLNSVLLQEGIRYNKLLNEINSTLKDLQKAIKGLVVMSESLEKMSASLFSNEVPEMWANKAYPSLKPLGAWISDLITRLEFIQKWIDKGIPAVFWISGFFFPQAFLTGVLQNYARKFIVSIDTINFGFQVLNDMPYRSPSDGSYIWGLFLEGARWNYGKKCLDESNLRELYTRMPVVWFRPEVLHKKPNGVYDCPVYKTLKRAGTLSTTGHSTNYVLTIEVPSEQPENHWIRRGVALICALDY